ncbi:MAG: hypothetical protein RMK65_03930 [Anaerolineae bacterium]|nr:hypothetical protein [Anaerolineae bacterium]MCX8066984.1 hypothetical protein [Anaerolineae bacterium]MDW7991289.1 hypothetical protein [Anaerolineae bacterium]
MNLRTRVLIFGGILGALIGVVAAYLYLRSAPIQLDESGRERLPAVSPGEALKVGLGILSAIRQIVGLGRPGAA